MFVGRLVALVTVMMICQGPAIAEDSPRENCAEIANSLAKDQLSELPAMLVAASRGMMKIDDATLAPLQPVIDEGPVRVNNFLIEKNYNDTLLKVWHLLYFDWSSLYLRCTYLKREEGWTLITFNFDSDEEDIELP